ncbi:MAG: hydrogenase maturation protease [Acidobacteria bacterium]|nr:hydrogenase maturation protease [Acidobacteriota bacterium]
MSGATPGTPLPTVLVAGIGNVFLGDDGFGVEVVQRLAGRSFRPGVTVRDFGIRGFDLAFNLVDGADLTILVDATARGGAPGTLYTIEPELPDPVDGDTSQSLATHGMDPVKVLRMAQTLGGRLGRVILVGCEPATFGPEHEGHMGLSAPVEAAVNEAVRIIEEIVESTEVPWNAKN